MELLRFGGQAEPDWVEADRFYCGYSRPYEIQGFLTPPPIRANPSCLGQHGPHRASPRLPFPEAVMELKATCVGIGVAEAKMDIAIIPSNDRCEISRNQSGIRKLASHPKTLDPIQVMLEDSEGMDVPLVAARMPKAMTHAGRREDTPQSSVVSCPSTHRSPRGCLEGELEALDQSLRQELHQSPPWRE